jgi:hypothetical protein
VTTGGGRRPTVYYPWTEWTSHFQNDKMELVVERTYSPVKQVIEKAICEGILLGPGRLTLPLLFPLPPILTKRPPFGRLFLVSESINYCLKKIVFAIWCGELTITE